MIKKWTFLGDTHGRFEDMKLQMLANPDADLFIQVGDMAAFWNGQTAGKNLNGLTRPVHFIAGNHDNYDFLLNKDRVDAANWPTNLHYIPRPYRWEEPVAINFMGGADSIDKTERVIGISYWKEEIPSYREFQEFADLPAAEIVVTHTAPLAVVKGECPFKINDPVSKNLDTIFEQMGYQPKLWLFGHFHMPIDKTINGTRFICIPCVHNHSYQIGYNRFIQIAGYKGVTITFEDCVIKEVIVPPTGGNALGFVS
jgi:predicted phosphodiesterase